MIRSNKVWADVMTHNSAKQNFAYKCNPTLRSVLDGWATEDEPTWGKQNEDLVAGWFHPGTLDEEHCMRLGLDKTKWAALIQVKTENGAD